MEFELRPFSKLVQAVEHEPPTKCEGAVVGQEYQIRFGAGLHRLRALRIDSDLYGPFAILAPVRSTIEHGFLLTVETEDPALLISEEDGGCCIRLEHPRDPDGVRAWLAAQELDSDQFNLMVLPDCGITIYFDSSGVCNGASTVSTIKRHEPKDSIH